MVTKMAVKDLHVSAPAKGDGMEELTDSIKRTGIKMPLVVNSLGLVIDGVRRFEAATTLGLKNVPVLVSNNYDEIMTQARLNREHGECFLTKDHYRVHQMYRDTLDIMISRRDQVRRLPNFKRAVHTNLVSSRKMLRLALGMADSDIQAAIQFVRLASDPTHPDHKYAQFILARMDEGMRGSSASNMLRDFRLRDDPRNIISADEQTTIIENALVSMATACEALARMEHLNPKLSMANLRRWGAALSPIKGRIQVTGNRIKSLIEEKTHE